VPHESRAGRKANLTGESESRKAETGNQKRNPGQMPEERGNPTGRNQVNSRNNATCHKFLRYGNEMSEPGVNPQGMASGCFL